MSGNLKNFIGSEGTWLGDERYSGERELQNPLGAVQMGLIYVNPEGPNGKPDPSQPRTTSAKPFARMAMNDEETVALIAGGHTFGKTHGAGDPSFLGPSRKARLSRIRASAGKADMARAMAHRTPSLAAPKSPLVANADEMEQYFFDNLFNNEWELTKSPAGAYQWTGEGRSGHDPGRHDKSKKPRRHAHYGPLAAAGPGLRENLEAFLRASDQFADAFARAWFKLTHRDMGPIARYLGPLVRRKN